MSSPIRPPFVVIGQDDVRRHLGMPRCIELMESAMTLALDPDARLPLRTFMARAGHASGVGVMPGLLPIPHAMGAKVITVYDENFARGLPSHQGGVLIFDETDGRPLALLHAGEITAIRTAAASALATRLLAREDARHAAIIGYGEQGEQHVVAMACVRDIERFSVWGRSIERAEAFADRMRRHVEADFVVAETISEAVRHADIICTTTAAREPILFRKDVPAGAHLNIVGSSVAAAREIDDDLVRDATVYVDYLPSTMAQAGEILSAIRNGVITADHIVGQIGDVLAGRARQRQSESEITLYKSLGIAAQDMVCAAFLHQRALADGFGARVDF